MLPGTRAAILTPQGIPRNGLVGWWKMNEGSGQVLTDYSGRGNHGQLGSAAGADANDPAWSSGGLICTTDDYVVKTNLAGVRLDSPFTILVCCLVSGTKTILCLGNAAPDSYAAVLYVNIAGNILLYSRLGATVNISPSLPVSTIEPSFLIVKSNGSTLTVSRIGSALTSSTAYAGAPSTSPLFSFGALVGSAVILPATSLTGYYAVLYNRILSNSEVSLVYRVVKKDLAHRGVVLA